MHLSGNDCRPRYTFFRSFPWKIRTPTFPFHSSRKASYPASEEFLARYTLVSRCITIMHNRRNVKTSRSFVWFLLSNHTKGLCWQTQTVFTVVNHRAFCASWFYSFFSEFLFRLLRVRFDKSSLCSILLHCFISTNWFLFLNVDVSSAKKFSLQTNVSNEMKICGIRIDQTMIIYESIDFSNKKSQLINTLRNLSNISSISFIHCTCLFIYLHRFLFFFYPFQSANKEKS